MFNMACRVPAALLHESPQHPQHTSSGVGFLPLPSFDTYQQKPAESDHLKGTLLEQVPAKVAANTSDAMHHA
jgi:hypothetical protein